MKNTELNKFIMKKKIVLSNVRDLYPNEEMTDKVLNDMDIPNVQFEFVKGKDKDAKELASEDVDNISNKKLKEINSLDYLEDYFRTKNLMTKREDDTDKKKNKGPSLRDIMEGKVNTRDTTDDDEIVSFHGNFMDRASASELVAFESLGACGWNSYKLMKSKDVSKRVTSLFKEKKKEGKKKDKKKDKQDDFIVKIATDNEWDSFNDFQEDMLNFTTANIFK
jgi:hypothetical protein